MHLIQHARYSSRALLLAICAGIAAAAALYTSVAQYSPKHTNIRQPAIKENWPVAQYPPTPDWSAFFSAANISDGSQNYASNIPISLNKRFRLAGTFFEMSANPGRKAIIDELATHQQSLVGEGDQVSSTVVLVWVKNDRVLLREGSQEEELALGFADPAARSIAAEFQAAPSSAIISTNRFGSQVETNQWVLSRKELLNYYQEVLKEPERLADLFVSMRPIYENQKISGYMLNVEGEGDFFRACGLREGDVIRKVNSMAMLNRFRGEYFIREFVENRVNAFVLDIERDGQPGKLIYMVR